jgi:DNA-binding NarL/FixJ family response regulator
MKIEPLRPAAAAPAEAADKAAPQAPPIRLWLVDDNEELRQILADLLGANREVECTRSFSSAAAALSALASQAGPDVILLDINIGSENGLDAVRPILSLSRSTRVLMLTTFFDPKAKSWAMDEGASGFLLKQYSVDLILESIRQAKSNPAPESGRRRRPASKERSLPVAPSIQAPASRPARPQKSWRERIGSIWSRN